MSKQNAKTMKTIYILISTVIILSCSKKSDPVPVASTKKPKDTTCYRSKVPFKQLSNIIRIDNDSTPTYVEYYTESFRNDSIVVYGAMPCTFYPFRITLYLRTKQFLGDRAYVSADTTIHNAYLPNPDSKIGYQRISAIMMYRGERYTVQGYSLNELAEDYGDFLLWRFNNITFVRESKTVNVGFRIKWKH